MSVGPDCPNGPPLPKGWPWLNRLVCRLNGHPFTTFSDGFKRRCVGCGREEWLMSRSYPLIGEAKYFWQHMDFDR